jgi:hypothetical protein
VLPDLERLHEAVDVLRHPELLDAPLLGSSPIPLDILLGEEPLRRCVFVVGA